MTPADALSDALRDDLAEARRERAAYRAAMLAALDSLHAAYNRIGMLERHVAEMREERDRFARSIFRVMESAE